MTREKWLTTDGQNFTLGFRPKTVKALPPNYYSISFNPNTSHCIFEAIEDVSDDIFRFKSQSTIDEAVREIQSFWEKREFFAKHKFPFRRGILLHGPQGVGKSCAIKMICEDIKNQGGIALEVRDTNLFAMAMSEIRTMHPQMPVVAIIEDIDLHLRHNEVQITNMMDGLGGFDNVVYLATTNYISQISERVRDRPSRFDRRFFIGYPEPDLRIEYFKRLAKKSGIGKKHVQVFAKVSEGFSFAHMKELFISVIGFDTPLEIAVQRLKGMGDISDENEHIDHRPNEKMPVKKFIGSPIDSLQMMV